MTKEELKILEDLYEALDKTVKTFHISYDHYYDEYDADINCDEEMIASIENAHADLKYFLSK